ncbi:MAG: FecR domain-containing protein [Planctomycetes bacterium]|nr:FecR domain-containing protein [Planctomycetota bacterium]
MTTETAAAPERRFEELLGLFFDGELLEADEHAFVALLGERPDLQRRFLEHVRMESMVAGLAGRPRADKQAFVAAVKRGIALTKNEDETRRFAGVIVDLVRGRPRTRKHARVASRSGPWIAAACAALVGVAVTAAWKFDWLSSTPAPVAPNLNRGAFLAKIDDLGGLDAEWTPSSGEASPKLARAGDEAFARDRLEIKNTPSPKGAADAAVTVELRDGSKVKLNAGSAMTFQEEDRQLCPVLESGAVYVNAKPQPQGRALTIRTRLGPEAAVVGTAFRVTVDANAAKVILLVDEGKVRFTSGSVARTVEASFGCVAAAKEAPREPYALRLLSARVSGKAVNPQTGKPEPNTKVRAVPLVRRRSDIHKELGPETLCDAEGRYHFDALPAGPVVLFAKTPEGGRVIKSLSGLTRLSLSPGEDAHADVSLNKVSLVMGFLFDEHGKAVPDHEVFALPQGSDGLAVPYSFNFQYPVTEFRAATFEGTGAYTLLIRAKGCVVESGKPPKAITIPADAIVSSVISVKLAPSAAIRGRILDAQTHAPLPEPAGADPYGPQTARTLMVLTMPNGLKQAVMPEADGSFVFDTALEPGAHELKVERFGYEDAVLHYEIKASETVEKDIELRRVAP